MKSELFIKRILTKEGGGAGLYFLQEHGGISPLGVFLRERTEFLAAIEL